MLSAARRGPRIRSEDSTSRTSSARRRRRARQVPALLRSCMMPHARNVAHPRLAAVASMARWRARTFWSLVMYSFVNGLGANAIDRRTTEWRHERRDDVQARLTEELQMNAQPDLDRIRQAFDGEWYASVSGTDGRASRREPERVLSPRWSPARAALILFRATYRRARFGLWHGAPLQPAKKRRAPRCDRSLRAHG